MVREPRLIYAVKNSYDYDDDDDNNDDNNNNNNNNYHHLQDSW